MPGSRVFVEGGPGIGKTTTALAAACEVVADSQPSAHSRALFVAFSRSAVAQVANSLAIHDETTNDRIEIATLDGLALRIISGFGRYQGLGSQRPKIQSGASKKISGIDRSRYQYNQLVPLASSVLKRSPTLLALIKSRWCIVVCDEFQDINNVQLEFIELLCGDRLLLLGDRNQHIYGWRGVDIRQFDRTKSCCDVVIDLGEGSYRDPSVEFPRLASTFRRGNHIGHQVAELMNSGRLHIEQVSDDIVEKVACKIAVYESSISRVAIFARHIDTVNTLAERLSKYGTMYEVAGTSEVYAEALEAMLTLCSLGLGLKTIKDAGLAFASVCASLHRGDQVPEVCRELTTVGYPDSVAAKCYLNVKEALATKSQPGGRLGDVVQLVTGFWPSLRRGVGDAQWDRAAREFRRCAESISDEAYTEASINTLEMAVEASRNRYLLDSQLGTISPITLLTYNQSKGREFDIVVHVHKSDDYWGGRSAREESLRLLGVAISRTRQKLVVVTPPTPNDIVRPFIV